MNNQCTHIRSPSRLRAFTTSRFFQHEFLSFLDRLCDSIAGLPRPETSAQPAASPVSRLSHMLHHIETIAASVPLETRCAHRFGNPAFRKFVAALDATAVGLVEGFVAGPHVLHAEAIATYLVRSFGNAERLDYGTGHELNFFAFVFCLHQAGALPPESLAAVVHVVFWEYFALVRSVIRRFSLEPAGSRGVWGIDDYQFLPFLFGAAQLVGDTQLTPQGCTSSGIARAHRETHLFCNAVAAITEQKSGSCGDFSAYLHFIRTRVRGWRKVREGLRKMYEMEILNKFVVMKHFPLSVYIPFAAAVDGHPQALGNCALETPAVWRQAVDAAHEQLSQASSD